MAKKILIVDNEKTLVEWLSSRLKYNNYDVIAAYDAISAVSKAREEKPDLIILDVIMPGKHGFQVCRELKTEPKYKTFSRIPVLMLTVYPDEREKMHLSRREGMMMEAEDYIQKPFDPDELLKRVERLIKMTPS